MHKMSRMNPRDAVSQQFSIAETLTTELTYRDSRPIDTKQRTPVSSSPFGT